ncbi:hypothetical protein HDU97_007255 [Phlyctochytrium planicorne]|nr:hypothetical protein HDU97_007255 [Phlyctochytrium planicorne]
MTASLLNSRIVIVGGGPGGLTLARILQVEGAKNVTVFEREPHKDYRPQGGTLDLHQESGQHALRMAKLHKEFLALARAEGEDMKILDKHGKVHFEEIKKGEGAGDRPEIDRGDLRNLLIDSLAPGTIRWDITVKDVVELGEGSIRLIFVEGYGTEAEKPGVLEADLVVAADGAWSQFREMLSPAKPIYSGISFLDITLKDIDHTAIVDKDASAPYKTIGDLVGRGSILALEHDKGLIAQRNSKGIAKVYAALRVPENWLKEQCGMDFDDVDGTTTKVASLYHDWSPVLLQLITANKSPIIPRPIYALPVKHTWKRLPSETPRKSMITLLGDAAHLMSPFAGEGVNLAMADAASLAKILASARHAHSLQLAVEKYETEMFKRSKPVAKESAKNLEVFFGSDAPKGLADMMKEYSHWFFPVKYLIKIAGERFSEAVWGRSD